MATVKCTLGRRQKRKDGMINVKLQVNHLTHVRYIATRYYVREDNFDESSGRILYGAPHPKDDVDKMNRKLQIRVTEMNQTIEGIKNARFIDINTLMDKLRVNKSAVDLFEMLEHREKMFLRDGNGNYAKLYRQTISQIKKFYTRPTLPIERVDYDFLNKLGNHWRHSMSWSPTSIGIHMRNIKAVINLARKQGAIDKSFDPFFSYKVPTGEPRQNMVLTPAEMAAIAKIELSEPLMRWARDMYCLMFCLIGVNPRDLFFVTEIVGGRLAFRRHKGKRRYSIKVPPQALHIIKRYRGEKYLLDGMDKYSDYRSAAKRINYKLKDIAELCGIKKTVTIYTCRHSWSAYARYLGVSKDDISAALGHKPIELPMVTEFYSDIGEEQRRVDEANKKVIRLILRTSPLSVPQAPGT